MEVRIPAEKFDSVVENIQMAKKMNSTGLILKSGRDFQCYPKFRTIKNNGLRLTVKHLEQAEKLVSSGEWVTLQCTDYSILLRRA